MNATKKMQFKDPVLLQITQDSAQLIVGDEMEDGTVNNSSYGQETQAVSVDDFVQAILADNANKSRVENNILTINSTINAVPYQYSLRLVSCCSLVFIEYKYSLPLGFFSLCFQ